MGRWSLAAVGVSGILGAGIYTAPATLAGTLGAASVAAYVLAAAAMLIFAHSMAILGRAFERTGGPYVYVAGVFGEFWGFQVGWFFLLARLTALGAVTNVFVAYLSAFIPACARGFWRAAAMAISMGALAAVNAIGIRDTARTMNLFAVGKLVPVIAFVLFGAFFADWSRLAVHGLPAAGVFGQAVLLLVFVFGGFEFLTVPAEESRRPTEHVPFALLASIGLCSVLFVGVQAVALATTTDLAAHQNALSYAAGRFAGASGAVTMAAGAMIATVGTNLANILVSSRMVYAFSRDGWMPPSLGALHPRFRTPLVAVILTAAIGTALAVSGTFAHLAALSAAARLVTYGACCAAVFRLQRAAMPALGTLAALLLIAMLPPRDLLLAAAAPAAGIAIYLSMKGRFMRTLPLAIAICLLPAELWPAAPDVPGQLAREIFKELIEINTTDSAGNTTRAAEAMAARLKAAGFPAEDVQVLEPYPRRGNLVARLRGAGVGAGVGAPRPLLLLAHLDVVEARREDWSFDPFTFLERDGYFYGRGSSDDKAMAAIWIANLIRYKREGYRPDRDLIVALTAGEESGANNGVQWLVKNRRDLIDAEFCLNEGGSGLIKAGKNLLNEVQASEKIFASFRLEVKNPGGHSSLPVKDNAIYHLAEGLSRLANFEFPARLNEVTRAFFERMSAIAQDREAADMRAISKTPPDPAAARRLSASSPLYNALLRTTCVATRLDAGHADNALPQTARAVINCRTLPDESPAEVRQTLVRVLADGKIGVSPMEEPIPSPPSPLKPEIIRPIEQATASLWPGIPVVAVMSTGATDSVFLRNAGIPTYGVSGLFQDMNDVRAHGKDERIGTRQFYEGQEFLYRLVKALSSRN